MKQCPVKIFHVQRVVTNHTHDQRCLHTSDRISDCDFLTLLYGHRFVECLKKMLIVTLQILKPQSNSIKLPEIIPF